MLKKIWQWIREHAWEARHFDYAPGDLIGYGFTAKKARADLLNKVEEKYAALYKATVERQYPAQTKDDFWNRQW